MNGETEIPLLGKWQLRKRASKTQGKEGKCKSLLKKEHFPKAAAASKRVSAPHGGKDSRLDVAQAVLCRQGAGAELRWWGCWPGVDHQL